MIRHIVVLTLAMVTCVVGAFIVGCETQAQTDAAIGTAAGAGIGAIVGHQSGHTTEGALIGGAVGGGAGYIIGSEADKKEQKAEVQSLREEMNTVTVNIKNSNGSVSQVRLTKSGTGYTGPRGEFYDHLPTEAELKPVYGF
jgi:uncharacterized protein YcfJ